MTATAWRWVAGAIGLLLAIFILAWGLPWALKFAGHQYRDMRTAWSGPTSPEVEELRKEIQSLKQESVEAKDAISSQVTSQPAAVPPPSLPSPPAGPAMAPATGPAGSLPSVPAASAPLPPVLQALAMDEGTTPLAVDVQAMTVTEPSCYQSPVIMAWLADNRIVKIDRLRLVTTMRTEWQEPKGWFIATGPNKGILAVEVTKVGTDQRAGIAFYNALESSSGWWNAGHVRANRDVFAPLWFDIPKPVDPRDTSAFNLKGGSRFQSADARGL